MNEHTSAGISGLHFGHTYKSLFMFSSCSIHNMNGHKKGLDDSGDCDKGLNEVVGCE
jgi:hypothetical protein